MDLDKTILEMGQQAREASLKLATLTTRRKNSILESMADELDARKAVIQEANRIDLKAGQEKGLSAAMLDRLELTDARFDSMVKGLIHLVGLNDPVGAEISSWVRPNGLEISKVRVPIGVIGIIFESRPNVTADASALCFKSSNAVILRGGSEAFHSNTAIAAALQEGGEKKKLPAHSIQLVPTTDREAIRPLVRLNECIDLIIPRGGEGLIRAVTEMATVPVIKHYDGICHIYVDDAADQDKALEIIHNAKIQRPGVCNAVETVLVHRDIAPDFLPRMTERLDGVELRGDDLSRGIVADMNEAEESDWSTEYLDLILSVKVVDDLEQATAHINHYGSKHSDAILSESEQAQKKFISEVDSAAIFVNASTRFNDGGEFGLGAEIGISTDKLHARGPMGLEELTTYKYIVRGTGQIRE